MVPVSPVAPREKPRSALRTLDCACRSHALSRQRLVNLCGFLLSGTVFGVSKVARGGSVGSRWSYSFSSEAEVCCASSHMQHRRSLQSTVGETLCVPGSRGSFQASEGG